MLGASFGCDSINNPTELTSGASLAPTPAAPAPTLSWTIRSQTRLHEKIGAAKLRVWFAPEDMQGGKKLIDQIEQTIQVNERLLLVISEHSMNSEWVMTEIRRARKTELSELRQKLFPIRLVGMDSIRDWRCFDADTGKDLAVELREYHIPDFSNWKYHDAFESAFADLLRDVRAQA